MSVSIDLLLAQFFDPMAHRDRKQSNIVLDTAGFRGYKIRQAQVGLLSTGRVLFSLKKHKKILRLEITIDFILDISLELVTTTRLLTVGSQ